MTAETNTVLEEMAAEISRKIKRRAKQIKRDPHPLFTTSERLFDMAEEVTNSTLLSYLESGKIALAEYHTLILDIYGRPEMGKVWDTLKAEDAEEYL